MTMTSNPTVGDLFCGAGGFSEGFRQAGFRILWAIDNWKPATTTFEKNFPGADVMNTDVLDLDFRDLEHVDILIGGPPCTYFSLANRGGNGDAKRGLELVERFLEAVKIIEPRYWVMENVPNMRNVIERVERDISESSAHEGRRDRFRKMEVLKAEDFGLPQKRHRLFSGNFPALPSPQTIYVPMSKVILGLPYPLGDVTGMGETIRDPLYDAPPIPAEKLSDQIMDTRLSPQEVESCKNEKENHPWYGRMRFPDDINMPSRTIGATATRSGRHTIVIKDPRGRDVYRMPTLRESASLQGFPITFQFWDGHAAERQRLIGNAVPPPVARAIATEMRKEMHLAPIGPASFRLPETVPLAISALTRRENKFRLRRTFKKFVPGASRYRRLELDNQGKSPSRHPAGTSNHLVEWMCVLYLGYAKDYISFKLDVETSSKIAAITIPSTLDGLRTGQPERLLGRVIRAAYAEFGEIPDASTLQAIWAGRKPGERGPDWILRRTYEISKRLVGEPGGRKSGVQAELLEPILSGRELKRGKEFEEGRWRRETVDAYTACAAVVLSVAVRLANESSAWLKANWGKHYSGEPLRLAESRPTDRPGPTRAQFLAAISNEFFDSSQT